MVVNLQKQKKNGLKNNRGMTLIEIVVVMGLLSIVGYFLIDMSLSQNKMVQGNKLAMDANEIYNRAQRYMLDRDACSDTFNGVTLPPNGKTSLTTMRKGSESLLTTAEPNNVVGDLRLNAMSAQRKAATNEIELSLEIEKLNASGSYGGSKFIRTITLDAKFHETIPNRVIGCYSQLDTAISSAVAEASEKICKELCANCWNPNTQKCEIKSKGQMLYMDPLDQSLRMTPNTDFKRSCDKCGEECNPCQKGEQVVTRKCRMDLGLKWCNGMHRMRYCDATCRRFNKSLGTLIPN